MSPNWKANYAEALRRLDSDQRRTHDALVESASRRGPAEPLRIAAGAGSGKTTMTITALATIRNERILEDREIVCTSFTRAARKAMVDKAALVCDPSLGEAPIATFNSLAYRWVVTHLPDKFPHGWAKDFAWGKDRLKPSWMNKPGNVTKAPKAISQWFRLLMVPDEKSKGSMPGQDYGNRYSAKPPLGIYTKQDLEKDESIKFTIMEYEAERVKLLAGGVCWADDHAAFLAAAREREIKNNLPLFTRAVDLFEECRHNMGIHEYIDDLYWYWKGASNLRFRLFIVDEAQDNNYVQLAIARDRTADYGRFVLVGDVRQSIYGFQGADPEFMRTLDPCETLTMPNNYRSLPAIVAAGNSIAGREEWVVGDPSVTRRRQSPDPTAMNLGQVRVLNPDGETEDGEFKAVVADLKGRILGGASPGRFAVLCRTNLLADGYERSLLCAGVPVMRLGQRVGILARREAVALFAWLTMAQEALKQGTPDPKVTREIGALWTLPKFDRRSGPTTSLLPVPRVKGLGEASTKVVAATAANATRYGVALSQLFAQIRNDLTTMQYAPPGHVVAEYVNGLEAIWRGLVTAINPNTGGSLPKALQFFREHFDLYTEAQKERAKALKADLLDEDKDASKREDENEEEEAATPEADTVPPASAMLAFVEIAEALASDFATLRRLVGTQVPAFVGDGEDEDEAAKIEAARKNCVTISTAHRSKGLEWAEVYVSATDYHYPSRRDKTVAAFAESRRLLYVACTRAEDRLTLTYHVAELKSGAKTDVSSWVMDLLVPVADAFDSRTLLLSQQSSALGVEVSRPEDYVTWPAVQPFAFRAQPYGRVIDVTLAESVEWEVPDEPELNPMGSRPMSGYSVSGSYNGETLAPTVYGTASEATSRVFDLLRGAADTAPTTDDVEETMRSYINHLRETGNTAALDVVQGAYNAVVERVRERTQGRSLAELCAADADEVA